MLRHVRHHYIFTSSIHVTFGKSGDFRNPISSFPCPPTIYTPSSTFLLKIVIYYSVPSSAFCHVSIQVLHVSDSDCWNYLSRIWFSKSFLTTFILFFFNEPYHSTVTSQFPSSILLQSKGSKTVSKDSRASYQHSLQ